MVRADRWALRGRGDRRKDGKRKADSRNSHRRGVRILEGYSVPCLLEEVCLVSICSGVSVVCLWPCGIVRKMCEVIPRAMQG